MLIGVLAVGAALGVGQLVAAGVSPLSSPYLAIGGWVIRLTPEWAKELAISVFFTYDKVALLGGIGLVLLLVAGLAGLASRRSERPGYTVVVLLGLLSVAAVITAPTFAPLDLVAPLAAVLAGVGSWTLVHRRASAYAAARPHARPAPREDGAGGSAVARRRLLLASVGVALGAGAAGAVGRLLNPGGGGESSRAAVGALPPAAAPPLDTAGADFVAEGTPPWLTPPPDFYRIDTALAVPQIRTVDYALRIHGMVDREITLSYEDLRGRPLIQAPVTLTCVSNEVGGTLVSNGMFTGVPMAELLREAGVRPGAQQIASTSFDGWTCNTPLGPLTDGRPAMLAIGLNDAPLPVEHGFPVRMVVPGLYGYVSACKWITDIEVTTFAGFTSYWARRGWARQGPVKTESRIDVPRREATVPAGRTTLAGVAWAQHVGIDLVELQVDAGPWQPAELAREPSVDSWRMWRLVVDLAPGAHQLRVRATDRAGYQQTSQQAPPIPDGASGWHTVAVTAV